jgi:hypothetical protein
MESTSPMRMYGKGHVSGTFLARVLDGLMTTVSWSDVKTAFLSRRSCLKSALWVLLCAVVQAGCVAVGVGYEGNERFRQEFPIVAEKRAPYYLGPTTMADRVSKWWVDRIVKKEDFLKAWGQPDRIVIKEEQEQWLYRKGIRWNGFFILPIVPIPIPLLVPVGWKEFTVEFTGDNVAVIETATNKMTGGLVCTFILVHGGVGCFDKFDGPEDFLLHTIRGDPLSCEERKLWRRERCREL